MAKSLNKCAFIGNLGKDPEIRYTAGGSAVANFSIACADDYKDKQGNKVEQTNWINIVAFGKLAEIVEKYVTKGSKVYIEGKQVTRKWQDKEGGDHYSTEIVANDMLMLDSRSGGQSSAGVGDGQPNQNAAGGQRDDMSPITLSIDDFDDDVHF